MSEHGRRESSENKMSRKLTLDLARENPELFKEKLLGQLHGQTKFSGKAWDVLENRGILDGQSISLDSNSWVSETRIDVAKPNRRTIRLGVQDLSDEKREQLLFLDEQFKGDKGLVYRLSHEINHTVASIATERSSEAEKLYTIAIKMRENGHALSALGSLDFYQGVETQAVEDVVELFNMYTINPDYLKKYLEFLTDPQYQAHRQESGLYTIPSKVVADNLFNKVEAGVSSFFK